MTTVGAVMVAASALSVSNAQEDYGQTSIICAPWSQAWDISQGSWWFKWYRWCYDPSTSDPSYEGSWYQELGDWEWGDPANLCPESGNCTVSTGPGSVQMSSTNTP